MSDVQRYFDGLDADRRPALQATWDAARRLAPDADEAMSYGMPTLKYRKRPLLGMTASAGHLSVHPFSPGVITAMGSALDGFGRSKGTVRFGPHSPLPESVLAELIRLRMSEIDAG